ncbi:hypothetical protein, partial [Staphylococcus aureus]|uniref:hypothetical protein n=1 Tax=Staphylococcus aureus TaxID=1280 RepID=UPI00301E07CA
MRHLAHNLHVVTQTLRLGFINDWVRSNARVKVRRHEDWHLAVLTHCLDERYHVEAVLLNAVSQLA